ncbi:AI-2E family transporter [Microbacterium yannicii]|uniref:AI-2E family transporter n=1 Tax=Microbacterium yannicii TaxID=671622 RepID=UPI0004748A2D|nr:AI-2E family transporter [Microbacterium yannicii]
MDDVREDEQPGDNGVRSPPPLSGRADAPRWSIRARVGLDGPLAAGFLATVGVLGALVLGAAVASIPTIVLSIVLALFLALALDPLVRTLERRRVSRPLGIAIVFTCFALLFAAFLIWVLPPVLAQIGQFIETVPPTIAGIPESEWFQRLEPDAQVAVATALDQLAVWVAEPATLAAFSRGILSAAFSFISGVSASFIVVALTLYFLASLAAAKEAFYSLAPARNRPRLSDLTERITASVGSALIGSIILAGLNAAVVFLLHLLIGLPFPALMGVIAFVITLIPLFGSVIFLVIGSGVALFSSPTQALIFAIAYLIYIQLESYVVSPRVMNKAVSIPAALVLIAALVGGALMGVIGVLVALPVTASILLVIREVLVPQQDLKT